MDEALRARMAAVTWYHRMELQDGLLTPGINDTPAVLNRLGLPEDLRGLRVLDLGTRDGYFAFEAERRGAQVVAVDYVQPSSTGFSLAAEVFASRVQYLAANVYHLDPKTLGTFDIVLFLGLLYHLPDPLGALRIVRQLTRTTLYLETMVLNFGEGTESRPLMQFFPGDSHAKDPTNFWGPNVCCVEAMLSESGFRVLRSDSYQDRAVVMCEVVTNSAAAAQLAIASGLQNP